MMESHRQDGPALLPRLRYGLNMSLTDLLTTLDVGFDDTVPTLPALTERNNTALTELRIPSVSMITASPASVFNANAYQLRLTLLPH